jgi:CHAT domain-containing protein
MINESTQDKEICQKTLHESAHFLKEAIRCWDWLFDHLQPEQDNFKISIADTFITTYKLLTTVLIKTRQTEEALLVCDRGRARALGDILVSKYRITKGNAYTAPLEYRADNEIISPNCNFCILFFALLNQKGLCVWVSTHRNPLFFIVCENECFNNPMQTLLFNNCVVNDAYDKMKIGKAVRCENRSLELLKMPQQVENDNQDTVDESALFSAERNIHEVKDNRGESKQHTDPLETLFNVLIAPALQNLEQEEIVIIPDGYMYTVPFAALRDPNTGLFLSETKRIRIAPSLITLKVLQECSIESHCKKGALIIGNPDVGEVMFEGEKTTISSLPSAEREAKVIGGILNVKPVIGAEASKEIIKQKLREGVALIHIAAHGSSEGGQIALAPPPQTEAGRVPEEQDYMLTMQDVQESGVRAQLVVLSCCHSGRGEIKAEGVVGMSRAFLAAGARAVVASLWAIDDKATLNFMVSFYIYLKMGESASKRLQQAMKEMREDGYDEPRHWAPFFLIGDDVTISV